MKFLLILLSLALAGAKRSKWTLKCGEAEVVAAVKNKGGEVSLQCRHLYCLERASEDSDEKEDCNSKWVRRCRPREYVRAVRPDKRADKRDHFHELLCCRHPALESKLYKGFRVKTLLAGKEIELEKGGSKDDDHDNLEYLNSVTGSSRETKQMLAIGRLDPKCGEKHKRKKHEKKPNKTPSQDAGTGSSGTGGSGTSGGGGGGGGAGQCFSPEEKVLIQGRGFLPLSDVHVGDQIATQSWLAGREVFQPILGFLHRDLALTGVNFIRLRTENGSEISLTPEHLLATRPCFRMQGAWAMKRAGDVNLDLDCLRSAGGQPARLTLREAQKGVGIIAPLTESGQLVVSGYVASCYTGEGPQILLHSGLLLAARIQTFISSAGQEQILPESVYHLLKDMLRVIMPAKF